MASAGVVLAGGRSSRMGTPKASLEWHGSTLLRRTVGILARHTPNDRQGEVVGGLRETMVTTRIRMPIEDEISGMPRCRC